MKRPAIFFDRDNTLIVCNDYLGDPAKVQLVPGAATAVARARRLGYATVVVSNQSGVARGLFDETAVHAVNQRLDQLLLADDPAAVIDRHEFCPFHPQGTVEKYRRESELRKPSPGMILKAADKLALDLSRSWLVGDAPRDIEAGRNAGCRTILFTDATLPASPAAKSKGSIAADYTASTLIDAIDFIEQCPEPPIARIEPAAQDGPPSANRLPSDPTASDTAIVNAFSAAAPISAHSSAAQPATSPDTQSIEARDLSNLTDDHPAAATHSPAEPEAPTAGTGTAAPAAPRKPAGSAAVPTEAAIAAAAQRRAQSLGTGAFADASRSEAQQRPQVATAASRSEPSNPAAPQIRGGVAPRTSAPNPAPGLGRVESLLDQMLTELRRRDLPDDEFSVSKLLAGVVQVLAIAAAFLAYLYRNETAETFIGMLLFANFLQVMTIALLIMGRQR